MEKINLTELQKSHLVEMANFYFKHRKWFIIKSFDITIAHRDSVSPKGIGYPEIRMNWLEFCIYHLIPKMVKKHAIKYHIDIGQLITNDRNIIDVIYRNVYLKYKQ